MKTERAVQARARAHSRRTLVRDTRAYARTHARTYANTHTFIMTRITHYVLINACVRIHLYMEPFVNKRVCRD